MIENGNFNLWPLSTAIHLKNSFFTPLSCLVIKKKLSFSLLCASLWHSVWNGPNWNSRFSVLRLVLGAKIQMFLTWKSTYLLWYITKWDLFITPCTTTLYALYVWSQFPRDLLFCIWRSGVGCIFSKRKWKYSQWAILIILKEAEESGSEHKAIFVSSSSWAGATRTTATTTYTTIHRRIFCSLLAYHFVKNWLDLFPLMLRTVQ